MALTDDEDAVTKYRPELMAQKIADLLVNRSKGLARSDVIRLLNITDVDEATIWRWMDKAKRMGLVEMRGTLRHARWFASEELRRDGVRKQLEQPLAKRSLVTYDEDWVRDYIPNKDYYLSDKTRKRMHARCPVGSATISRMDQHDLSIFLCGLPYASSRMEGNGYDLLATIDLIENNMEKKGATKVETQMILNHHQAIRYLIENISYPPRDGDVLASSRDIKTLHSLLANNLLKDSKMAGQIRGTPVSIQECAYKPMDIHESLESSFHLILEKACQIDDPFEQSFFLTVHLPYLQPFVDCNKRTARVACNIPLLRGGVIPMSWMDVDPQAFTNGLLAVYELNETSLLSEVFTDGYMRSIERFNIMSNSKEPDDAAVKYPSEIRQAVRSIVLDNSDAIPSTVDAADINAFRAQVEIELEGVREMEPATLFRNKLKEGDVQDWVAGAAQQPRDRLRT